MNVLVTGADGQLGKCLIDVFNIFDKKDNCVFLNRELFDLTKKEQMLEQFERFTPDVVINCAAYTDVEKSEENEGYSAFLVNSDGVAELMSVCREYDSCLIHISTDYVFDGRKKTPYTECDKTHPLNQYGATKIIGEKAVLDYKKGIVIRTSWLYSEYGKNFYKTMLGRIKEKRETNVVCDQIGTPTYAKDLAHFIVGLVYSEKCMKMSGIYNFSNCGLASWYDFASAIETLYSKYGPYEPMRIDPIEIKFTPTVYEKRYINPTTSEKYKTKAKRPFYSVLDKTKIRTELGVKPRHWIDALSDCMKNDNKI